MSLPSARRLRLVLAALSAAAVLAVSSAAAAAPRAGRCVVLVLPPGGWGEFPPDVQSALIALAASGAASSMSCAVPQPMSEAAGWATLGAGNRALWPSGLTERLPADPAARRRLADALVEANRTLAYPIEIGSVGQALHDAGLKTAVVGLPRSWEAAAVMDAQGRVDAVETGLAPASVERALAAAQYVVISGATAAGPSRLAELIALLGRRCGPQDLLVVLAVAPKTAPFVGLTPIVIRGPGFTGGSLTSSDTRRAGIVANIDLPPAILAHFGLPLPRSYRNGCAVRALPDAGFDLRHAIWVDGKGRQAAALRPVILPVLFGLQLIGVPASLLFASRRGSVGRRRGLLQLMCLPAATYLAVVLPSSSPPVVALLVILLAALVAGAALSFCPVTTAVALASGLTAALLAGDVLRGAPWQPVSLVGYSFGFGGRFYGIGNEAGGALIAAAALAVGLGLLPGGGLARRGAAALLLAAAVLCIGHPSLGANAGMTLAAVIGFGALLAAQWPGRRSWLLGGAAVVVAVAVLLVFACFDASRSPEGMTHLGRAWLRLTREGGAYLVEFLGRKLTSSWQGLIATPASPIAGAWVIFWSYAILRPLGFVRRACEGRPSWRAALAAVAIGGLAAAVLNDSTVAIPAMMLSVALPALGIAAQREQNGDSAHERAEVPGD